MILNEWREFILASTKPVTSIKERFRLENSERIVRRTVIEHSDDSFETMEVSELGDIIIWTTTRVWCIRKEGGFEKLIYLPRNSGAKSGITNGAKGHTE
jgi:hypothetical protein